MHLRLSVWMALFAFVAAGTLRAQAPASTAPSAAAAMPPGQIVAAKVTGEVSMVLNGATTPLHNNDAISQSATVITGKDSSIILVFSNGATTQLGADTSLVVEEFLQDPFKESVKIADLKEEPTRSHTKLHLTKGELIGQVKHLHQDQGSTFTVETPVGAAGIRGTTFRIIFRPSGTGAAFAIFSVATVEGVVAFSAAGQGQSGSSQASQQASETRARGGSVAVTTGREVVVTVSVDTDPKTGQVVVTAPVQVATTTPLNPVLRASIISQATTMAKTIEESDTTFSSGGTTSGGTSSGSSSSSSSSSSTDSTDKSDKDGTSGGSSSGSSSSDSTSTSTSSTDNSGGKTSSGQSSGSSSTGAASTLTSSIAGGRQINTSPGFTSQVQDLTPGAGS